MNRFASVTLLLTTSVLQAAGPVDPSQKPVELEGVGIEEKLGAQVDLGLTFIGTDGNPKALGEFFKKGRPVVLVFAYYTCPMLCSMVLNGTSQVLREIPWTIGNEYEVVTISIDPRDHWELAKKKRESYLANYERPTTGWHFMTDYMEHVKPLAQSVGFNYKWDGTREQYAHAAGFVILTPEGKVSRYLYGIKFKSRDVRLALAEASESKTGMAFERILLYCFHYDPNAKSYVIFATNIMRAGGAMVVLILGMVLWRLFRAENRKLRMAQ